MHIMPDERWVSLDLCAQCQEPILEILKNYEILQKFHYQIWREKSKAV